MHKFDVRFYHCGELLKLLAAESLLYIVAPAPNQLSQLDDNPSLGHYESQ